MLRMSQYFSYGNKGLPGYGKSTFDAMLDGKRTATTRFPSWYGGEHSKSWENIGQFAPGDYIQFTSDQNVNPQTRSVITRIIPTDLGEHQRKQGLGGGGSYIITANQIKNNPGYRRRWQELEGWNEQEAIRFFDKEKAGYGRQMQYTIPQEYAFVGSRDLNQFEPNVVGAFQKAAENAARAGYLVSTGAAKGADQLAAQSALSAGGAVRLSLPWNSYEKDWVNDISNTYPDRVAIETRLPTEGSPGMESVAKYHPHSGNLPNSARNLHARNYTILNPAQGRVAGVIALSKGSGGTEQAIRIANGENILVNRFSDPQSVPDRFL